jgi:ABC-2 type transport system ATP-binding protein
MEAKMNNLIPIKIEDLHKYYGKVHALQGVNIAVEQGEIFGFLGPNGAGKTTTIRCMLDMIRPQSGSIKIFGIDPQVEPKTVHAKVGYLPGELNLEANMKVRNALRYFVELRGNQVDWDYALELAERLELDLENSIKNLSKGNKQKVGLVQALMHKPELLIMDEPTSGLDPLMQQEVYRILRRARSEGSTIFFSSHIIHEVETLANRVAIINKGKIVEEAEPGKLIQMSVRNMQVRFREEVDIAPLAAIDGVAIQSRNGGKQVTLQVGGDLDAVIKALASYPVLDMDLQRQTLEQAFLAYYNELPEGS